LQNIAVAPVIPTSTVAPPAKLVLQTPITCAITVPVTVKTTPPSKAPPSSPQVLAVPPVK